MDHTHAGIMSSGVFMTAFWNSIIRAEAARIVFRRLSIPLLTVKSMGDDCTTEADQLVESERLVKEYLTLGKLMHFSQVSRPGEPFEFCSQLYDRVTETAAPTSWPRMLFRLLGKKPSPELLCSYNFELRNLDKVLKQKLDDFLFEVGWCLKNITQAAMPKKAAAKSKSGKKTSKKVIKEIIVNVPQRTLRSSNRGDYLHALCDPFMYGTGKKVPDLQTGTSATVRSFAYLPATTSSFGSFAFTFDPANVGNIYQTGTLAAAGVISAWSAGTAAPNYASMVGITSYRLSSAGIMFVPATSLTGSSGTMFVGATPSVASVAVFNNVDVIHAIPNALTAPITRAWEGFWTPRDFGSFSYYPFPASGTKSSTAVENQFVVAVSGAPATAVIGYFAIVMNYEVTIISESSSILSVSESPSDFPQMEYAANALSNGQVFRDLGFEGGIGDAYSSGAHARMAQHMSAAAGGHANWDTRIWNAWRKSTKSSQRPFRDEA